MAGETIGHTPTPPEVRQTPVATPDRRNTLENLQFEIEARNRHIASVLSLEHNEPDEIGRTRVQQERDRLIRTWELWERTINPLGVGAVVLIPVGTPVGLGSALDSYITGMPLRGILTSVFGRYGGSGYLERGQKRTEPLFRVSVIPEGQKPTEAVTLLVPNDLLTQAIQV